MMADDSPVGEERTLYVCNHHKRLSCQKAHCAYCGRGDCFATENPAMAQWHNNLPLLCYGWRKWADDRQWDEPEPAAEPETETPTPGRLYTYIDDDGLPTTVLVRSPEADEDDEGGGNFTAPPEDDPVLCEDAPWRPLDMREGP